MIIEQLDPATLLATARPWLVDVTVGIVIFVLGRWIAKRITALVRKLLGRTELDPILANFLASSFYWIGLALVLMSALDRVGVDVTAGLAVLGAAGLAIGLALKDSLSNVASGVMLILFRPFEVGHFVEAGGVEGRVLEVGFFSTKLLTPDNRNVIVPNADVHTKTITNHSAQDTRRIDMTIGISYGDDITEAKQIVDEVLSAEGRVLRDPAPLVAVAELADSSVNLAVRPWVKTEEYWDVRFALTERIKNAFDNNGITIPFPQRGVHMLREQTA